MSDTSIATSRRPTVRQVQGNRHGAADRPPHRTEEARWCHCGTRLSAYNPEATCWAHTARQVKPRWRAAG